MSRFIAVRKGVHKSQRAEMAAVSEDDDGNDQKRKKYSDRFQSRFSFWEIAFCTTSILAALRKAMAFSSVR